MGKRKRFTKVELGVGILALLLLVDFAYKLFERISERSKITEAVSNCRMIITATRIYCPDSSGSYPDKDVTGTKTANKAFRRLFEDNILDNEMIFGCPLSPFEPDGIIADPYIGPNSSQSRKAVQAGENHWAMTAGLSDHVSGSIPLIYENPVSVTWPPKWNADMAGKPVRGRAWSNGGIIVGFNDSSVSIQPLASTRGTAVGLRPDSSTGKDLFEAALDKARDHFFKGEVLHVE